MKHSIVLSFMDQCPPGKRGRPLSPGSVEASGGSGVCEKETRAGRTVYYRTAAGQETHKRKQGEKAESLFKRRAGGEKVRGRKSKAFENARSLVESRLGRPAKSLDEFLDALKFKGKEGQQLIEQSRGETESNLKNAYKEIVDEQEYSRIVELPDLYAKMANKFPAFSVSDYKAMLNDLVDRRVIDLQPINDRTEIKNPEMAITTSLGEMLYYVLWRPEK